MDEDYFSGGGVLSNHEGKHDASHLLHGLDVHLDDLLFVVLGHIKVLSRVVIAQTHVVHCNETQT